MSCKLGAEYHGSPYLKVPTYIYIHAYLTLGRRPRHAQLFASDEGPAGDRRRRWQGEKQLALQKAAVKRHRYTALQARAPPRTHTFNPSNSLKKKKYVARGSRESHTGEGSTPAGPVHAAIPPLLAWHLQPDPSKRGDGESLARDACYLARRQCRGGGPVALRHVGSYTRSCSRSRPKV